MCRRPGSNRYGYYYPRDFKSRASACSATPAYSVIREANRAMNAILLYKKILHLKSAMSDPDGTRTRDLRRDRAAL